MFIDFLKKVKKTHGDKYDYSKVNYVNGTTKVIIICPIHGEFTQTPSRHWRGCGCPKCSGNVKKTTEEYVKEVNNIHNNKYDYSKVVYDGAYSKITIICPIHGEFTQTANDHIGGKGCSKCAGKNKTNEEYIKKANQLHENKYDYSNTKFGLTQDKITIICPIHGEFTQKANSHLNGAGCPRCSGNKKKTTEEFIIEANIIHDYKYDYSKTNYAGLNSKVVIICPSHGEFKQSPGSHLFHGSGCPSCAYESIGEKTIKKYLEINNINYIRQKTFINCKYKKKLRFDFYIPLLNVCVEFDGIQHIKSIKRFGGEKGLMDCKIKDNIKNKFCDDNNILLYRIKHNDDVIEKLNKIFNLL
jgi:hypothetical protein